MPKRVLLCIDDETIGLQVRKLLLEHSGYDVLTADSGAAGLQVFRTSPIDAVVLDYFMPAMDGGQVALAMKSIKPEVPIVLLSAYLELPRGALSATDAFVTKGQSPEILLQTIREVLERRGK